MIRLSGISDRNMGIGLKIGESEQIRKTGRVRELGQNSDVFERRGLLRVPTTEATPYRCGRYFSCEFEKIAATPNTFICIPRWFYDMDSLLMHAKPFY